MESTHSLAKAIHLFNTLSGCEPVTQMPGAQLIASNMRVSLVSLGSGAASGKHEPGNPPVRLAGRL